MKVLLLGATGLLGHNVLLTLLDRGFDVVALVRNRCYFQLPSHILDSEHLQIIESDDIISQLSTPNSQLIINCVGTTDMSLLRYDDYRPGNIDICRHLLSFMESNNAVTLVHVSTANTVGYGTAAQPGSEECAMRKPFAESFYARSKREGEILLQDYADKHPDRHIVILNPGFMVGPHDVKPSSGQLLLAAYRKPLMAATGGGKSFVHVRDVAEAAVNSLTMGRSGERYLLTGEDMTLQAFYALQARVCGYKQRFIRLPDWLTSLAGRIGDLLRAVGIRTQLSLCNVRQLQTMEHYSHAKASRELAFRPTPISVAIKEFFDSRT